MSQLTRFAPPPVTLPQKFTIVREQLVIHTDFALAAKHRLLDEIADIRNDLCRLLDLPTSDEAIHVFLFETSRQFKGFLKEHYPDFPERRAFFLQTDTRLTVFAHWGDRVAEDLRHEVTHAYLHSVVPVVPLWLDEGIAESFEVPRGQNGLNLAHLKMLKKQLSGSWRPNLPELEQTADVWEMSLLNYAESWAWVHWMSRTTPQLRSLLRAHLRVMRETGSAPPLAPILARVFGPPEEQLVRHIGQLQVG